MPMQNSTLPINVQVLTPERFIELLKANKVKLKEPSKRLVQTTIQKIIGTKNLIDKSYRLGVIYEN